MVGLQGHVQISATNHSMKEGIGSVVRMCIGWVSI